MRSMASAVGAAVSKAAGSQVTGRLPSDGQLAATYFKSDPQCKDIAFSHYAAAKPEAVEKAKAGLEAKKYKVIVADTGADALKALIREIPDGKSLYLAGSTTLDEIGFVAYLKENPSKWKNLKAKFLESKNEDKEKVFRQAVAADVWISSVCAITHDGELVVVDASGTRVVGFTSAARTIVVASSSKIVPTYEDAVKRAYDFCLPLESARMRDVAKLPGSSLNYFLAIRTQMPIFKAPITVILVKNDPLGF